MPVSVLTALELHPAGNSYVNAQTEAGWSILKTELLLHDGEFASLKEEQLEVAYYLDTYFSLYRLHSA